MAEAITRVGRFTVPEEPCPTCGEEDWTIDKVGTSLLLRCRGCQRVQGGVNTKDAGACHDYHEPMDAMDGKRDCALCGAPEDAHNG